MKIMVATAETQGQRGNDYNWLTEGEIVTFGSECDGEAVDGKCGCRRAMAGLDSHKSGTTFKVVFQDGLTAAKLRKLVMASKIDAGWIKADKIGDFEADWVKEDAREMVRLAKAFPVGCIVEKRGTKFQVRKNADPLPSKEFTSDDFKVFEGLYLEGFPVDAADDGTERQVEAENAMWKWLEPYGFITDELEKWCLNATAEERMDYILDIVWKASEAA